MPKPTISIRLDKEAYEAAKPIIAARHKQYATPKAFIDAVLRRLIEKYKEEESA